MNPNKYKPLLLLLTIVALFNNTIIFAQAVQYTTTANGLDKFKQTNLITTTLSPTDASIATIQMDASKGFQKMVVRQRSLINYHLQKNKRYLKKYLEKGRMILGLII